ncbi:MAG: Dyp-type peroxidase family [Chloroflexi bacterium]|jgi:putative iron-dependent peroxidase|nr:Dyp-type peroxidase family [Chloroflexota bacterium]
MAQAAPGGRGRGGDERVVRGVSGRTQEVIRLADRSPIPAGTPQAGIFALGTAAHEYLELDLRGPEATERGEVARLIADLREPRSTVGGVNLVVGVRPELWAHVDPDGMPAGVSGFLEPVPGAAGYSMPATQHDLWVWIAGASYDVVFDMARGAIDHLQPLFDLREEIAGWSYQHDRDLTGFIDGSANPSLLEAPSIALVPAGQPGAGGSVLLFQRWVHDAGSWEALPVEEQERVIGRTKPDSIELDEAVRGPGSHVSRTDFAVDGEEQKIFRRNTPFGTVSEHGTVFVGFSRDQNRLSGMLRRMAGSDDGVRDALTYFSTATSGAYYWIPPVEALLRHATPED